MVGIFIVSYSTNFNLTGYSYVLNEESDFFSLREGFVNNNEILRERMDDETSLRMIPIVLLINEAEKLWQAILLGVTVAGTAIFSAFFMQYRKKTISWIVPVYIVCFMIFVIWCVKANHDITSELLVKIQNLV